MSSSKGEGLERAKGMDELTMVNSKWVEKVGMISTVQSSSISLKKFGGRLWVYQYFLRVWVSKKKEDSIIGETIKVFKAKGEVSVEGCL